MDENQVTVWKKWAAETIAESKRKGIIALLISKLEKHLTVYKGGVPIVTYDIGLGFNGLSTKTHAGDNATPEGHYQIIKKIPASQFYKALLINYPNEEDKKRFEREKKNGNIPQAVGIGGQVEIHGGGKDSLTRGCISVDNAAMDEIFKMVSVGTPVTIIGTREDEIQLIKSIKNQ
jgi:murein L,D-transpeptidase YafK